MRVSSFVLPAEPAITLVQRLDGLCLANKHNPLAAIDYRVKVLELIRVLLVVWIVNSVPLSS